MGYFIITLSVKSVGEIIVKIDQHLAKLAAKIYNGTFSGHGVDLLEFELMANHMINAWLSHNQISI